MNADSVLIVDDDRGTRETYTHVLSLSGYDVVNAAGGREALDLVRRLLAATAATLSR